MMSLSLPIVSDWLLDDLQTFFTQSRTLNISVWFYFLVLYYTSGDFPGSAVVKNSPSNAGDTRDSGLIPGLGRSPGEGNSNPLQYSCLGNFMDRGAWRARVHGVTKSYTGLSNWNNKQPCGRQFGIGGGGGGGVFYCFWELNNTCKALNTIFRR